MEASGSLATCLGRSARRKKRCKRRRDHRPLSRLFVVYPSVLHLLSVDPSILADSCWFHGVLRECYDDSGMMSSSFPCLYSFVNLGFLLFAQIYPTLEVCILGMASFKDVLIKDSNSGSSRRQQHLSSVDEKMEDQSLPSGLEEPSRGDVDILNIDELEVPDCEKFENLFLIGKLLGESVPLKTIASKSKANWSPSGEIKYVDMRNGFIIIKFANEIDYNRAFFISHGLFRVKFSIYNAGEEILTLSRNLSLLLLFG